MDSPRQDPYGVDRNAFFERYENFVRLNDALGYDLFDSPEGWKGARLHLAPMYDFGAKKKIDVILDGLREFAHRLQSEPSLSAVEGIRIFSWIVAEHPDFVKRLGFHPREIVPTEERDRIFPGETRQVRGAAVSREDFLKRYGE